MVKVVAALFESARVAPPPVTVQLLNRWPDGAVPAFMETVVPVA
jgi:hypothetical protein